MQGRFFPLVGLLSILLLASCQQVTEFFSLPPDEVIPPQITSFTITNLDGPVEAFIDQEASVVSFEVGPEADLGALVAEVHFLGKSISPESGATVDFRGPVTYTVVGDDGKTRQYVVHAWKASAWSIKGSWDPSWNLTSLVVEPNNPHLLTVAIDGLFDQEYEFVINKPTGSGWGQDLGVTDEATVQPFVFDSAVSEMGHNARFRAESHGYRFVVDISNPDLPTVTLEPGLDPALPITNEVLLSNLKIKGDLFSSVNGEAVAPWVGASPIVSSDTATWEVFADNNTGEFGFTALEGFLSNATFDVSSLTSPESLPLGPLDLTFGGNSRLDGRAKANSVYTITVTVDASKAIGAGRYQMGVSLKSLGSNDWALPAWSRVYFPGSGSEFANWNIASSPNTAVLAGRAVLTFTATMSDQQFKITPEGNWGQEKGFGQIVVGEGSLPLSDGDGNIQFTAVPGQTYQVFVDFAGSFGATGLPQVTVVLADRLISQVSLSGLPSTPYTPGTTMIFSYQIVEGWGGWVHDDLSTFNDARYAATVQADGSLTFTFSPPLAVSTPSLQFLLIDSGKNWETLKIDRKHSGFSGGDGILTPEVGTKSVVGVVNGDLVDWSLQ